MYDAFSELSSHKEGKQEHLSTPLLLIVVLELMATANEQIFTSV